MEMIETIFRKIPKLRVRYLGVVQNLFKYVLSHDGIKIMCEEWDYLVVLDACRYDYFKQYNNIKGRLERKRSLGSSTPEWVKKNFPGKYPDVVYVSGNPYISRVELKKSLGRNPFFHLDEVWDHGWNERFKTVLPNVVTEAILRNSEEYPGKKIIGHYMQPHRPFIANKGLLMERWVHPYYYAEKGNVSMRQVKEGYITNLKLVLKEVKRLVEELVGKVVITSDHGNCFGEYWTYGHPRGVHIKPLIEVPWLVIER